MPVASTQSRADYFGTGATSTFVIPFYFFNATDLTVLLTDSATGLFSTLTLGTDYSVSGAGVSTGGSITMLGLGSAPLFPSSTQKISILRQPPITQLTVYPTSGPFPAASHQNALDLLTMEMQQLAEAQGRALTIPANITAVSGALPIPVAGQMLGWNASGTAVQNWPGVPYSGTAAGINYLGSYPGSVSRSVNAKLQDFVSVADFGADPTGATDSTGAIQAALNAAGLFLGMGTMTWFGQTANKAQGTVICGLGKTYKISSALQIPPGVTFDLNESTINQVTAGADAIDCPWNGFGGYGYGRWFGGVRNGNINGPMTPIALLFGSISGNTLTVGTGGVSGGTLAIGQVLEGVGVSPCTITAGSGQTAGSTWTLSGAAQTVPNQIPMFSCTSDSTGTGLFIQLGNNGVYDNLRIQGFKFGVREWECQYNDYRMIYPFYNKVGWYKTDTPATVTGYTVGSTLTLTAAATGNGIQNSQYLSGNGILPTSAIGLTYATGTPNQAGATYTTSSSVGTIGSSGSPVVFQVTPQYACLDNHHSQCAIGMNLQYGLWLQCSGFAGWDRLDASRNGVVDVLLGAELEGYLPVWTVTAAGSGYAANSVFPCVITGTAGTMAQAYAISNGSGNIIAIYSADAGKGYTGTATCTVTGGSGNATGSAVAVSDAGLGDWDGASSTSRGRNVFNTLKIEHGPDIPASGYAVIVNDINGTYSQRQNVFNNMDVQREPGYILQQSGAIWCRWLRNSGFGTVVNCPGDTSGSLDGVTNPAVSGDVSIFRAVNSQGLAVQLGQYVCADSNWSKLAVDGTGALYNTGSAAFFGFSGGGLFRSLGFDSAAGTWNGSTIFQAKLASDTQYQFTITTAGNINWGAGGVSALDTVLKRVNPGTLQFPCVNYSAKTMVANGAATTYTYPSATNYVYLTTSAASLAVTLPTTASWMDGLVVILVVGSSVATATWVAGSGGATIVGAPASLSANVPTRMIYHHATTSWYPY